MENLSAKLPDIAALDEILEIQNYTTNTNKYGEELKTFATVCKEWARVEWTMQRGGEDYEGAKQTSKNTVHFTIRYNTAVKPDFLILYESEYYDILHINHIGRRRFTILVCEVKR